MKPGAALEIVEEDLTFPGRPVDADEGSEFGSSSSTLGGDGGGAPSYSSGCTRSLRKRIAGQGQELGELRGLIDGGPAVTSELNVPSSSAPEIARTQVPVPVPGVQRSRSLTHPSAEANARSSRTPPTGRYKKRPSTAQSAPPQKLSRAPSPSQLGMAAAAAAAITRLSFSRKRPKSKAERPWTANSAPSRCSSVPLQTVSTPSSALFPPSSYSLSYRSAISGSVPPTPVPPLSPSPPPKAKTDAMSQAILMESGVTSYMMTPYPGAKPSAAKVGHKKDDVSLDKTVAMNASTSATGGGTEVGMEKKVALENPRDHTVLETIYNEMHAERFVNLTPLSLLGNALGLWFRGAFMARERWCFAR